LHAIVSVNLLKTSRNLLVISDLCASVAEKLLLGLRIDAIRSQLARIPAMIAAEPGRTSQSTLERAGRPHRVDEDRHWQIAQELGNVGDEPGVFAGGKLHGRCADHDGIRSGFVPLRSPRIR
jgi:hypothetical protein